MGEQPTPSFDRADVERIVRRDFTDSSAEQALAILDEYGTESWQREPDRVRLATLKLADGSVERLRTQIDIAKLDYRDVLAPAEYPAYMRKSPSDIGELPREERQAIIDADWNQYQDWFTR